MNSESQSRDKLIFNLQLLSSVMNNISEDWSRFDLNNLPSNREYPFKKSFDELTFDVDSWVDSVVEDLKKKEVE